MLDIRGPGYTSFNLLSHHSTQIDLQSPAVMEPSGGVAHAAEEENEYTEGGEGSRRQQGRGENTATEASGAIDAPRVAQDANKNINIKNEDFAAPVRGDEANKAVHVDSSTEAPALAPAAVDSTNSIDTARGAGFADASVESGGYASGDGAHTPGFEDTKTAGLRQQDINTPAQRQKQPQHEHQPAVAARGSMVPDKEDDDDEPDGTTPRHTLQNYASRESGAALLESSPGAKGMANLLVDSKDKYAISPCEDKRWAVLGLSEDIVVRTIKISSHEKYSSLVKDFQVENGGGVRRRTVQPCRPVGPSSMQATPALLAVLYSSNCVVVVQVLLLYYCKESVHMSTYVRKGFKLQSDDIRLSFFCSCVCAPVCSTHEWYESDTSLLSTPAPPRVRAPYLKRRATTRQM